MAAGKSDDSNYIHRSSSSSPSSDDTGNYNIAINNGETTTNVSISLAQQAQNTRVNGGNDFALLLGERDRVQVSLELLSSGEIIRLGATPHTIYEEESQQEESEATGPTQQLTTAHDTDTGIEVVENTVPSSEESDDCLCYTPSPPNTQRKHYQDQQQDAGQHNSPSPLPISSGEPIEQENIIRPMPVIVPRIRSFQNLQQIAENDDKDASMEEESFQGESPYRTPPSQRRHHREQPLPFIPTFLTPSREHARQVQHQECTCHSQQEFHLNDPLAQAPPTPRIYSPPNLRRETTTFSALRNKLSYCSQRQEASPPSSPSHPHLRESRNDSDGSHSPSSIADVGKMQLLEDHDRVHDHMMIAKYGYPMSFSTCSTDTGLDTKKIQKAQIFRPSTRQEQDQLRDHWSYRSGSTVEIANKDPRKNTYYVNSVGPYSATRIQRATSVHSRSSPATPGRMGQIICGKSSDCSATAASSVTMSLNGNCPGLQNNRVANTTGHHCAVCSQRAVTGVPNVDNPADTSSQNGDSTALDIMGRLIEMFTPACCAASCVSASNPSEAADKAAKTTRKATESIKTVGSDKINTLRSTLSSSSHRVKIGASSWDQ